MKKGRYIVSIVLNVLIVAAIGFATANIILGFLPMNEAYAGVLIGKNGSKLGYLFEFGVLAGIFGFIVAIISIISDIVCLSKNKTTAKWVSIVKMISAGVAFAAAAKFFLIDSFGYAYIKGRVTAFQGVDFNFYRSFLLDWHGPLFFSVVAPALIIIDYLFFSLDPKVKFINVLWGFVPGVLYMGFVVAYVYLIVAAGKGALPDYFVYALFRFNTYADIKAKIGVIGGGIVGVWLATLVMFALRALVRKCALKEKEAAPAKLEDVATKEEQPVKEEASAETVAPAEEAAPVETEAAPVEEKAPVAAAEKTEEAKPAATTSTTKAAPAKTTAKPATKSTTSAPKKTGKKVIILKTEGDKARAEGIDIKIDNGDEEAEEAAERKAEAKSTYRSVPRVYHISKQPSGKWQVKLATGERAIKLFDTQQQAIVYAKGLVKTQGGSIRIHAVSGKMRKE